VSSATALAAFGRNDVRGTYRDPLLVMIVLAPVIWTVGVVVLTPLFTEMLSERYDFDLVPYYPLVLTAFLLLTSIIIAGGLAAFLVLDEIDAGTLAALRVTPVPLSTFFAYRAGTVMVVTTVYVTATMSFSGILEPGLMPALIPIGLLAGLSAVVTLLLIVTVAHNKIQGIAMVRALGMLIAGLPCLPWFIDSAWNLAFGVLPPYIGRPRRSGSPATTAPGGRIFLSAWSITSRSRGFCFGASLLKTPESQGIPQP
jgi:fluoroquinolone transport system permease protein